MRSSIEKWTCVWSKPPFTRSFHQLSPRHSKARPSACICPSLGPRLVPDLRACRHSAEGCLVDPRDDGVVVVALAVPCLCLLPVRPLRLLPPLLRLRPLRLLLLCRCLCRLRRRCAAACARGDAALPLRRLRRRRRRVAQAERVQRVPMGPARVRERERERAKREEGRKKREEGRKKREKGRGGDRGFNGVDGRRCARAPCGAALRARAPRSCAHSLSRAFSSCARSFPFFVSLDLAR